VAAKRASLVDAGREIAAADPIMDMEQVLGPQAPKPESPKAVRPDSPIAAAPQEPMARKPDLVSPTMHIRKETLWLLRRVATARSLADGKRPSISRVIEGLVDAARDSLEGEATGIAKPARGAEE
jgi:hypothetical protein